MYILFEFRDELIIAREHTFKYYFEPKGANIIRMSTSFDELARLTDEV